MEQFVGTCYRQPMFAQFEKDLHEWIENSDADLIQNDHGPLPAAE